MRRICNFLRSLDGGSDATPVLLGAATLVVVATLAVCLPEAARAAEDPDDAKYVAGRLQDVLEYEKTGREVVWANPTTKKSGIIKVERTYYKDSDTPCREYLRTQDLGEGLVLEVRGTGCRLGDGRWFLDEQPPAVAGAPGSSSTATAGSATSGPRPSGGAAPSAAAAPEKTVPREGAAGEKAKAPSARTAATTLGPAEELLPTETAASEAAKGAKTKTKAPPKPQKRPPKPQFTFSLPARTAL